MYERYRNLVKYLPYIKISKSIYFNADMLIGFLIVIGIIDVVVFIISGGKVYNPSQADMLAAVFGLGIPLLFYVAQYILVTYIIPILITIAILITLIILSRNHKIKILDKAFIDEYGEDKLNDDNFLYRQMGIYNIKRD